MQALKDIVLRLLNVYVSPFVENLNTQDLTGSVLAGNFNYSGLHLKKTILERFGLPVDVIAGDIGSLSITFSWTQLKTQPVKVVIDDVYVLARIRPQGKVDPEEDARAEQETKMDRLKKAEEVELAASQVGGSAGSDANKQSYVGAILSKILANIQIQVKGIHLRYEDGSSTPEHPFAAGLTISEFKAVSADANWVETFIQDGVSGIHKLVKLEKLSVYFDTDTGSLDRGPDDRAGTINALKQMLAGSPKHQYILKPVTGEARLIMNKSMSATTPHYDAQVIFDEIGVVVDRDQYRDTLSVIEVFHFYRRTHQYHKFRPDEEEFKSNAARARLKFARKAITSEVHERHRRWTWDYLADRRDKRKKYVEIYVSKLALPEGKALPVEDGTTLAAMENNLSYEDIRFFRSVARAKAKQDAATRRKLEAERLQAQQPRQTWGQWLWGTGPKEEDGTGMTEDEKKELDDIIDYDATAQISIDSLPKDFMRTRIAARLNKGSFSLRVDPHGKNSDVIALVFDSFSADGLQLTESIQGRIALGGFRVYDGTTPDSLYPQIVRVKDIESKKGKGRQTSLDVGGTGRALAELSDGLEAVDADADPFFVMEVETKPLDGRADNAVSIRMRHLEIIYHKGYVEAIVAFFKPPASQLESINALLDAAGQTLDGIRKETRAGLEYALEQHKTLDIKLDMNAPIIIIPMDVKVRDSQALVLDAGHIAVESDLANKAELKDVQSKRGKQYSDDDYRQLEGLMYDKLTLQLESTQLLMGPTVEACMSAIESHHSNGSELHILERINMSFSVQNAILNAPNLTRFKINGDLPELQLNFSDRKYKNLMRFIDVAIPKFGDGNEVSDQPVAAPQTRPLIRAPPIEDYILDDTRSIRSVKSHHDKEDVRGDDESTSDKGGDRFYEAQDVTTEDQRRALQQITFQFSFSVGKLQTSLFKSTSTDAEKLLARATLEGFGLTFALRQYDMSVDLFLRDVTLAMAEQDKEARPLLSSVQDRSSTESDIKLVQVRYLKVQKESPEFMTKHEGVDTSIDTELSTFGITLAPEPILSLYDFIMTTFVGQDEQPAVHDAAKAEEPQQAVTAANKMRIRVKLTSAQVSLENNGNRFALLALPSADVALLLRNGTMRVVARLGNLSIEDLSEDLVAVPAFKKLLTIEGGDLADFSYETFDPTDQETFPGYNSSINLRAGSFKFTLMEKPIHDLYAWAMKFARMKAVYDAASQAAVQRASEVTRMHYDVVIKTPIIVLPREGVSSSDSLVLRLGEIVAKNEYLGDRNDTATIEASLRGINVTSDLMVDAQKSALQLVDDVAITANIRQIGAERGPKEADKTIATEMSDVKMSLTARQYALVMDILRMLPRVFSFDEDDDEDLAPTPPTASTTPGIVTPADETQTPDHLVNLEPELVIKPSKDETAPTVWTAMELTFSVGSIALELYTAEAVTDLQSHSIARFALIQSQLRYKSLSDGATEATFSLNTLAFTSTRAGNSVFRDIVPQITQEENQIMVQYTTSGADGNALAIVTIDSPKLILAVDPLAALLDFAVAPFKTAPTAQQPAVETPEVVDDPVEGPATRTGSLAFRVNVIHATVIVLADDTDPRSQAIQLNIKEVLLSSQSILALKVDQLGMSFGRMDKPNDRVRFLDELNVALSLDTRRKGSQQMTSFEIDIPDTVIFRASYTDIMLISDIANKAISVATKTLSGDQSEHISAEQQTLAGDSTTMSSAVIPARTAQSTTARRTSISRRRQSSIDKTQVLISKEQLKANVNGFQFVLVGDLQELPMVHLTTNEFAIAVSDWTGDLKVATSITTSIRYFNLTNSYFEPLMDPWRFDIQVNRTSTSPGYRPLNIRITAAERLELNVTSAFIELGLTSMAIWNKEAGRVKEGRGNDAPFRIRNNTGLTMLIWPESRDLNKPVTGVKSLDDGADVPWRFEDRRRARENVSALRHNALGIQLRDSPWEALRSISVDREGEHVLSLRPRLDKVAHQIACEIKLENNIKVITFRSTLNVENQTSHAIEMIVVDSHGKASTGALKIEPGQSMPLPMKDAYDKRFRLRPLKGFGFDYGWSMPLHWRQLMKRPIRAIACHHQVAKEPSFYIQAEANFDKKDPSTRLYPRMTLMLRAPLEVENLLPYDFEFKIHDKHSALSSSNFLVKGGSSPIHTVEISHLLLLSISPQETNLIQSDYAIVSTDDPEIPTEEHVMISDRHGVQLRLKLHYHTFPNSGGAFKVQVYSPYVFINKTGLPFDLSAKRWSGGQKAIAGGDLFELDYTRETPTPFMFGFPNDDRRNRLFLKVNDSKWSQPLSFEPVSADMQIVLPSNSGYRNTFVGLSYTEGLGKYKYTKVITIAPRFMIKNLFSYALKIRQHSTKDTLNVSPGARVPLHDLDTNAPTQLSVAFDEPNLKWSAPFNLSDIGRTYITLERQTSRGPKTYLMRIETHIEGSSIFLYISRETDPWPLKIRNETSLEFTYKQVDEDETNVKYPVRTIRPKGEVEYTWDYPTAGDKRVALACEGIPLSRTIDMMAIGVQPPEKIPPGKRGVTVSFDIQADGNSQLLVISPYNEETSVYKPARRNGGMRRTDSTDSLLSATTAFETVTTSDKPTFTLAVELEGVGISVITKAPAELFYATLRGLSLGYSDFPAFYQATLDCKWIQIDNQLFGGLYDLLLFPTRLNKTAKELEAKPTLQTKVAILKDQSHGVFYVKYATILLQSMSIELDEDFLYALLDFVKFKGAGYQVEANDVLILHPRDIVEPDITSTKSDVFFEALSLQPIALEVSFMRNQHMNTTDEAPSGGLFYYALNALTMTLGNVNAAPVKFNSLILENVRLSIPSLQERVILHYQEQFVAQIYRVLGSADFLGNPVGLFNNISSGFSDIFYEPYNGMVMHGNTDIGFGIARGWTSFAKKTVFGISDSVTKVTSSIGKGLSAATLDAEYQSKRRMAQRRNKPRHALYGVAAGASAFADSMTSAFEGVASKPLEGAEKSGALGFAAGVGQGVIGLFTKPVVGVMDFVSASTEGIRNTTTILDQDELDKIRPARFIASDGVLRPFSEREALGQKWLRDLSPDVSSGEAYVAHLDIPGDDAVAIVSNTRILLVQLRRTRIIWETRFEDLQSLSVESAGIGLVLRGGEPGPFLPITDQTGREWFFKSIGKVVVAYNKAHQRDD